MSKKITQKQTKRIRKVTAKKMTHVLDVPRAASGEAESSDDVIIKTADRKSAAWARHLAEVERIAALKVGVKP